jgi:hypothetical protein
MANFYDEMQAIAFNAINEFKQGTITYTAIIAGNGTPDDPGEPREVATEIAAVTRGVEYRYIDGTNIIASDGQLTRPANLGVTPSIEGYITVDGRRHRIVQVSAIPPAGIAVAYSVIYKR